jgi:hypothetical protein
MDAPVGVFAEEAGDAELLFTPHHAFSIPARNAGGNRTPQKCCARNGIILRDCDTDTR